MKHHAGVVLTAVLVAVVIVACGGSGSTSTRGSAPPATVSAGHDDLLGLFGEFRGIETPTSGTGLPDYTPAAMSQQRRHLDDMRARLAAMDISDWPVDQQVDYHLVRAEMNGLDFYHRVLRPWSRDPGLYLQTQAGAGPVRGATVRIRDLPLGDEEIVEVRRRLGMVPEILQQARSNLVEGAADLVVLALHYLPEEVGYFDTIAGAMQEHHPELVAPAEAASGAVSEYGAWLEENRSRMTAPAGIGVDNYNWWFKNVQLVPYTMEDFMDIVTRDDDRLQTFLALERQRNRGLPELEPVATVEEWRQRKVEGLEFAMEFLEQNDVVTVPDYLSALGYLDRGPLAGDQQWPRPETDFFDQTGDREPLPELFHEFIGHYLDGRIVGNDDRPIRGTNRLYAIDMVRSEGWAFALEELMMHVGYLDERSPRAREVVYWQSIFRTCRAIADMNMHANTFTLQEAIDFCYECAPNGWLLPDGYHVWYEMETNLRFPGWHSGMVIGKFQFMKLFAEVVRQRGDDFAVRDFIDDYLAAGRMPFSLIRWEMTGQTDEMEWLLSDDAPLAEAAVSASAALQSQSAGNYFALEPVTDAALAEFFSKQVDVFGVQIVGTETTPDYKVLHAANVMAQYLDNDEDGVLDNQAVVDAMVDNRALLVMFADFDELENSGIFDSEAFDDRAAQDLEGHETLPERGFDATLEEVHHLVASAGYAQAFPDAFGARDSRLAEAMNLARGGHFEEVPDEYPEGAWYHYGDETCDYECMAIEYHYWAMTSILGWQAAPERCRQISIEWKPCTPDLVETMDPTVYALLTDPQYNLPTVLPDGSYRPRGR